MFLNCHSFFSFQFGVLSPKQLIAAAAEHNIARLALTDINSTSGCMQLMRYSAKSALKPVLGVDFRNGNEQKFVALACNIQGFEKINRLLSRHLEDKTDFADRCEIQEDVMVIYPWQPGKTLELAAHEYWGVQPTQVKELKFGAKPALLRKMVILQSVSFLAKSDFNLHRLLRAMHLNCILSKLNPAECALPTDLLCDESDLMQHYHPYPDLIKNTLKVLDACQTIDFEFNSHKNKALFSGSEKEDFMLLKSLTDQGAFHRYGRYDKIVKDRINKELDLIRKQDFVSYFLINWDIISYAQKQGFYYVGRGSGANSIVAYCLRITDVDPIELDLYFERFINLFRKNPPDFDIDFSWKDRDQITEHIFNTYGKDHVCLMGSYNTFQLNSTLRELGKVFGLPTEEIEGLINQVVKGDMVPKDKIAAYILMYGQKLINMPRHLSIHASGVLISEKPIYTYTATSLPPKGYPVSQFDMHEAEDLGLYKFDILSQRGLGHIKDSIEIIKQNRGISLDIHDVKNFKTDPAIVRHLEKGHTMGCFYVESPAMRMLLAKLECKDYLTLVAASSIIRPGVAQSGMMREYISRHHARDKGKSIAHPVMWDIMPDTYGVMVYQEDVIKVAHLFAGLDLGEADVLRRGMSGKYRSREEFKKIEDTFFSNCDQKGYDPALSKEVWRQIESFAGYSFAKGHSASFAVESYQSMYLKAHFPLEFMVGVINNFGGFYRTEFYVHEARKWGATIEGPCINNSEQLTRITDTIIYLGFVHIANLEDRLITRILDERNNNGFFKDLQEFTDRVAISLEQLILLVRVGAFRFIGKSKQQLLWEAHFILTKKTVIDTSAKLFAYRSDKKFDLPTLHYDKRNDLFDELELLGFTLSSPFELLERQDIESIRAEDIPKHKGKEVQIIGHLVTTKPTRTKKGESMFFGTFLDKNGDWIDTVHFPPSAKQYPYRGSGCYLIRGKVSEEFSFFTIEVSYFERLSWWNAKEDSGAKTVEKQEFIKGTGRYSKMRL